jgi:acetyl esterase/lipase
MAGSFRMVQAATILVAMMLAPAPATAQKANEIPVGPVTVTQDRLPEMKHRIGGVTVRMDIAYSTLPGFRPLHLDLYAPTKVKAPRPLSVFVHGGGWLFGSSGV